MSHPTNTPLARRISHTEQVEMGLVRAPPRPNFVPPAPPPHPQPRPPDVVDPYAPSAPQPVHYLVRHDYSPVTRAQAMLLKTSAVTLFLSLLTAAALAMLDHWSFLGWLLLASVEWVFCFVLLAVLDWRETPSALAWKMSNDYKTLMEREQRARLQRLYGYAETLGRYCNGIYSATYSRYYIIRYSN
jgi:hypothetical protein